jgi:hypothetical protein
MGKMHLAGRRIDSSSVQLVYGSLYYSDAFTQTKPLTKGVNQFGSGWHWQVAELTTQTCASAFWMSDQTAETSQQAAKDFVPKLKRTP